MIKCVWLLSTNAAASQQPKWAIQELELNGCYSSQLVDRKMMSPRLRSVARWSSPILKDGFHQLATLRSRSSNPAMEFPCLDKMDQLSAQLRNKPASCSSGDATSSPSNEPVYGKVRSGFKVFKSNEPLFLDYGGVLPKFQIAYETWGTLNSDRSNAILIHTGLSASSHAKSSSDNPQPGWWEKFIGPGNIMLDTNKFFVICTNVLGGCYGSTGPSSPDPADGSPYATRFPMLSIQDIIRGQQRLVKEHLGIHALYASVGCSMGGMQSLAYAQQFPELVEKVVTVSACARSHPSSIAMRHAQRQVLMADQHWARGFYYPNAQDPHKILPHVGMKLAREIATVTYRSGPEWESRFGTERLNDERSPVLCPDFLIETYLDHQGEKFSLEYDANSFLYLSKTMDLFDLSQSHQNRSERKRAEAMRMYERKDLHDQPAKLCDEPYEPTKKRRSTTVEQAREDLKKGMEPIKGKDILVVGVKSDGLFPYWQQREIADLLDNGEQVKHVELDESQSLFGHDTFLLDLENVGGSIGKFLNKDL
ncbi:LADA_0F12002g1_1 [Lachancea dasiensis]|uniref:LADA_0F12002g1_1 n=1 Tax=Lachancea dasiensis TaxID=1072105 RepID=A0A1G4JMC0_9SACH|nr:LADA_0F12002g1_1 [Lachancea dasiensis]